MIEPESLFSNGEQTFGDGRRLNVFAGKIKALHFGIESHKVIFRIGAAAYQGCPCYCGQCEYYEPAPSHLHPQPKPLSACTLRARASPGKQVLNVLANRKP